MITIAVKYITVHYFTKCFLQDVNSVLACFHEYIQSAFRLKCKLQVTVTLDTGYILNLFTSSFTSVNLFQLNPLCYNLYSLHFIAFTSTNTHSVIACLNLPQTIIVLIEDFIAHESHIT